MKTADRFPRPIRLIENAWIPLSDGTRLAAKIWLPLDAERDPVPAIVDYIPYRKRDGSVIADEQTFPYFAGHGYASVRVDIRGTGDSDGLFEDEYVEQEQKDGVEVLDWIARQPWCSGATGMIGISWGGFSALQVAAHRPKSLKAIVTLCSTDDRYADDMHYMGGCLLNDTLVWGTSCFVRMTQAPDPEMVGADRWREMWQQRLENVRPTIIDWVAHQRRDAFWKHGSICEDFSSVDCAVYAVGGWADGYSNAIFRMLSGLKGPRKGLIGPWGHKYPQVGVPGPAIGFLQECLRWWDHWLKGKDTGVMKEPMVRSWILDPVPPAAHYDERPGHWVADPSWPSPHVTTKSLSLGDGVLAEGKASGKTLKVRSLTTVGIAGGEWCAYGLGGLGPEMPLDQRWDDGSSLVFDSEVLDEDIPILGAPVLEAEIECDRPTSILAARLSDVSPSGEVTRVTYGLLNLSHRDGHETPTPMAQGRRYRIRLQLNEIGYLFRPGHRIRLSLSTAYWPMAFPTPELATVTILTAQSQLHLPVRMSQSGDAKLAPFQEPEIPPALPTTVIDPGKAERSFALDPLSRELVYSVKRNGITRLDSIGTVVGLDKFMRYSVIDNDPLSARTEVYYRYDIGRDEWQTSVSGRTVLTATKEHFRLQIEFDAFEKGQRVFSKNWLEEIPRDLV